ncbi:MAG: hypothetical protein RL589_54 [Actinomycetota bacterium]
MNKVIVTGASGILGRVLVQLLNENGYFVIGLDQITSIYQNVHYQHFEIDLTSPDEISRFCKTLGVTPIYGLVNNAAVKPEGFFSSSENYSTETWNKVLDVNLTAPFLLSRNLFPNLKISTSSVIVNISSIYGLRAPIKQIYDGANYPAMGGKISTPISYSVTKSAILGLTRHLSSEWGDFGIRVNSVTPGGIFSGQNDVFVKKYSSYTSLGRMATELDIGKAILFLLSDGAEYISGHNLIVDGGWTI